MPTREQMKQEAVKRMRILNMLDNPINEFENEDKLNLSEGPGILFWLDDKQNEYVADFEREFGYVVYHVIHNMFEFGECFSMLFVSPYEEEWEQDRDELRDGYQLAYVYNATYPECSEMGTICVKPMFGGVVRTC